MAEEHLWAGAWTGKAGATFPRINCLPEASKSARYTAIRQTGSFDSKLTVLAMLPFAKQTIESVSD